MTYTRFESSVLILMVLLLVGCRSMPDQLFDSARWLKFDGLVCNQKTGVCYNGIGVFSKTDRFDAKYYARGKIDFFHVGSCHRSQTIEELCDRKLDGSVLNFSLCNLQLAEGVPGCGFKMFAAEKDKGRHSFAFMLFDSDELLKKAKTICNGKRHKWDGTSACQSAFGNFGLIEFDEPMLVESSCGEITSEDQKKFKFTIDKGFCVHSFLAKNSDFMYHSLVTYGHDREFVRLKEESFWKW